MVKVFREDCIIFHKKNCSTTECVTGGFSLVKRDVNFWVNFERFWIEQYFCRQLGQYWKLAWAQNWTTIGKFSLPKSTKHCSLWIQAKTRSKNCYQVKYVIFVNVFQTHTDLTDVTFTLRFVEYKVWAEKEVEDIIRLVNYKRKHLL